MSFDLAFWVGEEPDSDEAAGAEFEKRTAFMDEDDDDEDLAPASPTIAAFVADLLAAYPALGEPGDENSPWATGPEPGDITGDFAYLTLTFSGASASADAIVEIGHRHHLVCYDPQSGTLV